MLTNNFDTSVDFFNSGILLGKTINSISASQEEGENYITVYFTDSSCLEFVLNNMNDVFYMEEILDD